MSWSRFVSRRSASDYIRARERHGTKPATLIGELNTLSHLYTVAHSAWGLSYLVNPVPSRPVAIRSPTIPRDGHGSECRTDSYVRKARRQRTAFAFTPRDAAQGTGQQLLGERLHIDRRMRCSLAILTCGRTGWGQVGGHGTESDRKHKLRGNRMSRMIVLSSLLCALAELPLVAATGATIDTTMLHEIQADLAQQAGLKGQGVVIGVISDGMNGYQTAQVTGDLPATIGMVGNDPGTGAEGTALMEVIHQIAPQATLAFCGDNVAPIGVQDSVCAQKLVQDFRAQVVVDDAPSFGPPYAPSPDSYNYDQLLASDPALIGLHAAGNQQLTSFSYRQHSPSRARPIRSRTTARRRGRRATPMRRSASMPVSPSGLTSIPTKTTTTRPHPLTMYWVFGY